MPEIINYDKLDDVQYVLISLVSHFIKKFNTNVSILSGGRSYNRQVEIYKDKFGDDWKKYMPANSAHLFEPGKTKAGAIDFRVQDMFITKVHAELLNIAAEYGLKGIGIDIFNNYVHADIKDRDRKLLLWAYDPTGKIIYLN